MTQEEESPAGTGAAPLRSSDAQHPRPQPNGRNNPPSTPNEPVAVPSDAPGAPQTAGPVSPQPPFLPARPFGWIGRGDGGIAIPVTSTPPTAQMRYSFSNSLGSHSQSQPGRRSIQSLAAASGTRYSRAPSTGTVMVIVTPS
jgi:hypothetical protein